jgi:hypothetical protein
MDATRSMFLQSSSKNNSEIIRIANSIQSSAGNKTRVGSNLESGSNKRYGKSYESTRNKKVHIINNLKFNDVGGDLINGINNISKMKNNKNRFGQRASVEVNMPPRSNYNKANNFNEVVFNEAFELNEPVGYTPQNFKLKKGLTISNNAVTQRTQYNASVEHTAKKKLLSDIEVNHPIKKENKHLKVALFDPFIVSER